LRRPRVRILVYLPVFAALSDAEAITLRLEML